jgi:folate-binding protein YgfZ
MIDWTTTTAARVLEHVRVLGVTGDDARAWLSGQTTNDLAPLAPDHPVYSLFASVRGKVMADAWVLLSADGALRLLVPTESVPALLQSFDKYIIMEDVAVTELDERVISVRGAAASDIARGAWNGEYIVSATAREGVSGVDVVIPAGESDAALKEVLARGAAELTEVAWEDDRIARLVPRFGTDFGEGHYPQEAGLKAAVSFQKGCYLGQEVVCTLESRGQVTRLLCALDADPGAAQAGAEVRSEDDRMVGTITSAPSAGSGLRTHLGYVKRALATPGTDLRTGDAAIRVIKPVELPA